VHVGVEGGFDRNSTKAHIAYHVDNLDYWHKKLINHGITIKQSIPIEGFKRFECRDPFGNRIEMIQPLKLHEATTIKKLYPHNSLNT